jgi:tetratricopeptide (TPR) repeat protein
MRKCKTFRITFYDLLSMRETLTPEHLAAEGQSAYQNGDFQAAERAFAAAADGFAQAGDALNAAEMANNRSVTLLMAKDARGALRVVEGTEAVFASAGDARRQGMALANRGAALEALHRNEEAISAYEQAAELFKSIGEHELRAPLMESLAVLQLRSGRRLQGLVTMQSGLEALKNPAPRQNILKKLLQWLLYRLGL